MNELMNNLYYLALDASFWLVIGLFIGGLFKTLIPTEFLQRHLSSEGFGSIVKAAILGAPLPLCSCGVIPAAMGLREAGASKSATTSFLVSTPETGVDSVFITYAMMGPFMAVVRPITALVSAITAGTLVSFFDYEEDDKALEKTHKDEISSCCSSEKESKPEKTSCCSSKNEEKVSTCCSSKKEESVVESSCCASKQQSQVESSCCSSSHAEEKTETDLLIKIINGVKYAFTELLDNIIFWLVIGLFFAAVVQTFVPSDTLIKYGSGWLGMLVMLLVGIPMYVCATASTPLAAGFLLAGVSPGAVIVFLLAGPATNMATLGIITKQMGKRTMWLYLGGIMSTALISGFVVNYLVALWQIDLSKHLEMSHGHIPEWLQLISFLLLFILSLRKFHSKN
jgi:uncharacterized membrane protein YraQ (UPF0718 family)